MTAPEEKKPDEPAAGKDPASPAAPDQAAAGRPADDPKLPAGKGGEDPAKVAPGGAGPGPAATPAAPTSPGTAAASPAAPTAPSGPRKEADEPAGPAGSTASPRAAEPGRSSDRPAAPTGGRSGATPASASQPTRPGTPSVGGPRPGGGGSGGRPPGAGAGRPAGGDATRPPVAPRTRSGGGGGWVGGLIGGLVGGAAAWLVLSYLLPPAWQTEMRLLQVRVDEIGEAVTGEASSSEQLADLAARVESLEIGPDSGLIARVDGLEAEVDALQQLDDRLATLEQGGAAGGGVSPELEQRLAALEQGAEQGDLTERLDALEAAGGQASDAAAQLQQVEERLAALESDLTGLAAGGSEGGGAEASATMTALRQQVDQIQSALDGVAPADQLAALEQRLAAREEAGSAVAALQEQLQQVAGQVEELTTVFPEFGEQMTQTVDELAEQLVALEEDQDTVADLVSNLQQQVNAVQEQVNTVDQRVTGAEESIETAATRRDKAATLALAVGQLDSAIRQSEGYDKTLSTIQTVGSDDQVVADAVQALQPTAESGPVSRDQLRQEFDQVANEIVQSASESGGMLDRAWGNISSLVSVRPVGAEVEGDGADARVARAEAKLEQGDLAGAIAELEGLEGPAAEAAAPWLEQAKARLAAEQAVVQLQTHATGLLSQPE